MKPRNEARASETSGGPESARPRRGRKPKPIVPHPEPLTTEWVDPPAFSAALELHARRHGDSMSHLRKAVLGPGERLDAKVLYSWSNGSKLPSTSFSMTVLERIEERYRLPVGYFRAKLPESGRAPRGHHLPKLTVARRRRIAWHLPDGFDQMPAKRRAEIVEWVERVIVSGQTDYRVFLADAMKSRYALRFPGSVLPGWKSAKGPGHPGIRDAPARLVHEVTDLMRFKTKALTTIGERRIGVWGEETASQKIEHMALMFGALCADPEGPLAGAGLEIGKCAIAHVIHPQVWDWYLGWRERRRGFFTSWEVNMLALILSLTRKDTGWLWQNPHLAEGLCPIPGVVAEADVETVAADWAGACERIHRHAAVRAGEVRRLSRVHRDPFEPILAVLDTDSPVGVYRTITSEVLSRMPDARRYPVAAAEASRAFLILRLGLHLGLRQKNLRQLMICPKGQRPRSERQLELNKRGELRWSERDGGWEVMIPSAAFKNATSSFFGGKAFRLVLPDLEHLYREIDRYLSSHRDILLGGADDPGTFFVKTVKRTSSNAAYDQTSFYEAWRLTIQRYGIYNPYTGKGAVKGLLPHGPHSVRDVLATHVLKRTGSYEQASYAIQDTPEMVAKHYGRFLPQDKASMAAKILNEVWAA